MGINHGPTEENVTFCKNFIKCYVIPFNVE